MKDIITYFKIEPKEYFPRSIFSIGRKNGKPFSTLIFINKNNLSLSSFISLDENIDEAFFNQIKNQIVENFLSDKHIEYLLDFKYLKYLENFFGIDYVNGKIYLTEDYFIDMPILKDVCVKVLKKYLKNSKEIQTHTGQDLDQNMSILVVAKLAKKMVSEFEIIKHPQSEGGKKGLIVDLQYSGSNLELGSKTLVFDHHDGSAQNALYKFSKVGIYVPQDLLEIADKQFHDVSIMEDIWFNYYRYLSLEFQWKIFCEKGKIWKKITKLESKSISSKMKNNFSNLLFSLMILKNNIFTSEKYGDIVIVNQFVTAGSILSYNELKCNYYISISTTDNKSTFVVSCNHENILDEEIKTKLKEISSEIYFHPNGKLAILGGSKNEGIYIKDIDLYQKFISIFKTTKKNNDDIIFIKTTEDKQINDSNINSFNRNGCFYNILYAKDVDKINFNESLVIKKRKLIIKEDGFYDTSSIV